MRPLNTLQEKKRDLYKNLLLVALLSTGISLCANYISNPDSIKSVLWCGIACIIVVFVAYLASFYKSKSFIIKTKSVFITNKQGLFLPIKRYRLAQDMYNSLVSVFSENKAYEKMWKDAFCKESKCEAGITTCIVENNKVIDFVGELIEYAFIEWFSTLLCDYFNKIENKEDEIEILTREKISEYLLQNRVLEMISKPYEDRENFVDHKSPMPDNGKICMMFKNGIIYNHFDLKLPKKSSLYKRDGALYIKNPHYTLKFVHNFKGFNTSTPLGFNELYLNLEKRNACVYEFAPFIEIKLNPVYFLLGRNWEYLNWIDIIGEKFGNHFSFEYFLKEIGYETAFTNYILRSANSKKHAEKQQIVATIKEVEVS